ncbi:DUF6747 family protein [Sediminicola luteus]|jgi:hypothetical protein|uniref:DUF6747 family protein n=1 Tax=Sediminicola luteus TaxID=319238 RepID=UPI001553792E|nr:DUF6747 family protein [Sediminicola luteus]
MGTLLQFKKIYFEAFRDCHPDYLVKFLKVYTFFCVAMFVLGLYALVYRAFTGFHF